MARFESKAFFPKYAVHAHSGVPGVEAEYVSRPVVSVDEAVTAV